MIQLRAPAGFTIEETNNQSNSYRPALVFSTEGLTGFCAHGFQVSEFLLTLSQKPQAQITCLKKKKKASVSRIQYSHHTLMLPDQGCSCLSAMQMTPSLCPCPTLEVQAMAPAAICLPTVGPGPSNLSWHLPLHGCLYPVSTTTQVFTVDLHIKVDIQYWLQPPLSPDLVLHHCTWRHCFSLNNLITIENPPQLLVLRTLQQLKSQTPDS